ncbi:hypothetical protein [Asanoa siamensis]|uniref:PknH-like extracellular domain-containing protein n=1 Tax=Asanoa siamensis TaxID=926357 RepID=A0ABQ4CP28_9ACTN|nr:hypothetical protein [Asanoa siamensis]GIF73053.1 hypothetical protein Asi02nite_25710 [Asanoa siamensis]
MTRRTVAVLAVLALSALAGCTNTPATPASSSPATSGSPTQSPAAEVPRTIPASAFFEMPRDRARGGREPASGSQLPLKVCDDVLAPGPGVLASAVMMQAYKGPQDPPESIPSGVLYQTIRTYEGENAAAFLDRVRGGLADCTSYQDGGVTLKVKTAPLSGAGDEALTIDRSQPQLDLPGNPVGGEQTNRVVVVRMGAVVTILDDTEYERSSSDPAVVQVFVDEATKAIRSWLG